ncbi:hypothetical protein AAEX37_01951 [Oligella sp. MSHR50489EDL]
MELMPSEDVYQDLLQDCHNEELSYSLFFIPTLAVADVCLDPIDDYKPILCEVISVTSLVIKLLQKRMVFA